MSRWPLLLLTLSGCSHEPPPAESLQAISSAPGNIVGDNGFESETGSAMQAPWGGGSIERNPNVYSLWTLDNSKFNAMSGHQNAIVTSPNGQWNAAYQWITLTPHTLYRAGVWVKSSPGDVYGTFDFRAPDGTLLADTYYGSYDQYHYVTGEFDSGSYSNAWALVGYWSFSNSSWVRMDNLNVTPSLVADGDFEKDGVGAQPAAPWFADSMTSVRSDNAYAGSRAVRVANTDANWHAVNQWVAVQPNTNYRVEGYLRQSPYVPQGGVHVDVRAASTFNVIGANPQPANNSNWQSIYFTFNSGPETSVLLYAGYMWYGSPTYLDVDSLAIHADDPPALPSGAFPKPATGPASCSDICGAPRAYTSYVNNSGPVGSCAGGFVDSGLGGSNRGCSDTSLVNGHDITCYCQPYDQSYSESGQPSATLAKAYTQHLGQLTNTTQNDTTASGYWGTDNAQSVSTGQGRLFLFGDAMDPQGDALDPLGYVANPQPAVGRFQLPALSTYGSNGQFTRWSYPGASLGGNANPRDAMQIPSPLGGLYVFFVEIDPNGGAGIQKIAETGAYNPQRPGWDIGHMTLDQTINGSKFLFLTHVVDPANPNVVYLYGTPTYSTYPNPVYLARADLGSPPDPYMLTDPANWLYFSGRVNGVPQFSGGMQNAIPLFDPASDQGGLVKEVAVRYHAPTNQYVMEYMHAASPRGVVFRTAPSATGPWSSFQEIWDAGADGYQVFMHNQEKCYAPGDACVGYDDGIHDHPFGGPNGQDGWGGEYAAYFTEDWSHSSGGVHHILYTMSSWNPYQVQVLDTVFTAPGGSASPPSVPQGTTLVNPDFSQGLNGWAVNGFVHTPSTSGGLTTPAESGTVWQRFIVGTGTENLDFYYCGGGTSAGVFLYHDGSAVPPVGYSSIPVRNSLVRNDSCTTQVHAQWNLRDFDGEAVMLSIAGAAGSYVTVPSFTQN